VATTVLIVDDHPSFREAARLLLESEGFAVVGESATGEDALEHADALQPDVVLLDVNLPGIDGLEVARRLHGPRIVLVSSRDAADVGPLNGSVLGFIPKSELSGATLREVLGA
jgi:DNA-binding NarL/FixJ family response regulator